MEPRISKVGEKKLVGKRMKMSLANNQTGALWQSFMAGRKKIKKAIGADLYSVQMYDASYFDDFDPQTEFEKWATVEVADFEAVPGEMETFTLKDGLYAVFMHRGAELTASETFRHIFGTWLPNSEYALDDRPHFEVLGGKYKNLDPNSEEEIYIPIKPKKNAGS
jgi:AraC family transcriptional regulator